MIEAVGINTVSTPSQTSPAAQAPSQQSERGGVVDVSDKPFVSSRIRMDNLLDLAILEVRSSDTGDVIRQFPTEQQIRAFEHASEIPVENRANDIQTSQNTPVETTTTPLAAPQQTSTTTPVSTNSTAQATNAGGTGSTTSSQSILV